MSLSKPTNSFLNLRELMEETPHKWDKTSSDQFLISLDPVFKKAKLKAKTAGDVAASGFADRLLEVQVDVIEPIFELTPEYKNRVPSGENPQVFISKDPSYDPVVDTHSNLSLLVKSLKDTNQFETVELGSKESRGPVVEARGKLSVDFIFGSSFPAKS